MSECFVTVGLIIVGIIAAFGIWEAITPSKVKDDGFFGYEDGYDDMYDDYIKDEIEVVHINYVKRWWGEE
jgi:hypothetical protein